MTMTITEHLRELHGQRDVLEKQIANIESQLCATTSVVGPDEAEKWNQAANKANHYTASQYLRELAAQKRRGAEAMEKLAECVQVAEQLGTSGDALFAALQALRDR